MERWCCEACGRTESVRSHRVAWQVAQVATYVAVAVMLGGAVLLGLLVTVLAPLVLALGAPVASVVGQKLDEGPRCTQCRRYLTRPSRVSAEDVRGVTFARAA
ncbi:MAG: hypothetical protein R3A52_19295 [Polyangiales bacterium]